MKIVYLASEVFPFFKTGGLADVMQALPKKMQELGHEVSIIMPKYSQIPLKYLEKIEFVATLESHGEVFNLVRLPDDKINYYFIENSNYYERDYVYGHIDQDVQYAMFCELTLRFLKEINLKADILHCNDWQTGPLPYFLKTRYAQDEFYSEMKTIFTIHNLMYQGKASKRSFERMGYSVDKGYLNFLELGMEHANMVTTVSKTYAEEIKYPYFSEGLEWMTNYRNVYGVLNGIDVEYFDPATNPDIAVKFSVEDNDFIEKKKQNKYALQKEVGLPESDVALISMVTRLVEGKGLDLVSAKIEDLLLHDAVQVLILGSGDKSYEEYYEYLTKKYPDKFKVYLGYNVGLANRIYAGSDMFLMPSRYEPCGLSQMIAMRFGTVAIVRETGGLKDSVIPYDEFDDSGNGFTFTNFVADDMLYTIKRAEMYYYDDKPTWEKLVKRNMEIDFSWEKSARAYIDIYEKAQQGWY